MRYFLKVEINVLFILMFGSFLIAGESIDESGEKKFQEFIAQAIVEEQFRQSEFGSNSPVGSVVAHMKPNSEMRKEPPLRVWICCVDKKLYAADVKDFRTAIGEDRSKWPTYLYVFEYQSVSSDSAKVQVWTYYNMGLSEMSRGGNRGLWEIQKKDDSWVLIKKTPTLFWD